ncbi:unnamed protein product, partial [Prorocentrum cordatum]
MRGEGAGVEAAAGPESKLQPRLGGASVIASAARDSAALFDALQRCDSQQFTGPPPAAGVRRVLAASRSRSGPAPEGRLVGSL